jgi:ABC-2 type transport system ATP-binding protein
MTAPAIDIRSLTHRFRAATVLRGVNLAVPDGSIYGFLGPNGAGKTTTLRLILGLLTRQEGGIALFGQALERQRPAILRRVGSSIETPSVYGHLTAVENLEIWRRVYGCGRRRIAEVLDLVDLAGTGSKRADRFSLGMKQRLGIAVALLHEPSLLILDEPTNGLDPHGILDMRRLLAQLNRERGVTILVSSHILSEIERLVTHIGVIHHGSMRFEGTLDALRARQARASKTTIDTDDNSRAATIAAQAGFDGRLEQDRLVCGALSRDERGRLTGLLAAAGVTIYEIATVRLDLEQIFLDLVGGAE